MSLFISKESTSHNEGVPSLLSQSGHDQALDGCTQFGSVVIPRSGDLLHGEIEALAVDDGGGRRVSVTKDLSGDRKICPWARDFNTLQFKMGRYNILRIRQIYLAIFSIQIFMNSKLLYPFKLTQIFVVMQTQKGPLSTELKKDSCHVIMITSMYTLCFVSNNCYNLIYHNFGVTFLKNHCQISDQNKKNPPFLSKVLTYIICDIN